MNTFFIFTSLKEPLDSYYAYHDKSMKQDKINIFKCQKIKTGQFYGKTQSVSRVLQIATKTLWFKSRLRALLFCSSWNL